MLKWAWMDMKGGWFVRTVAANAGEVRYLSRSAVRCVRTQAHTIMKCEQKAPGRMRRTQYAVGLYSMCKRWRSMVLYLSG